MIIQIVAKKHSIGISVGKFYSQNEAKDLSYFFESGTHC